MSLPWISQTVTAPLSTTVAFCFDCFLFRYKKRAPIASTKTIETLTPTDIAVVRELVFAVVGGGADVAVGAGLDVALVVEIPDTSTVIEKLDLDAFTVFEKVDVVMAAVATAISILRSW
jgi:hypothetical protein